MRQYLDFLDHPLVSVAGLLLVLGLVTASISACGCCGALHEHHGLTSTYSWVLGTIVLVELGLGLMLYTASSQVSCSMCTLLILHCMNAKVLYKQCLKHIFRLNTKNVVKGKS